ncbi:2'-5' RNA ligase family protein [Cecembia calidifontis]|uniref:2'-5' RNA ligase n=1 Tax=Cecembia calidifontis TaxID=1187080 RepID=A0A4Q7P5H6_9BACT|nr:2'-5' RNA ligase family protein [Cecembia calidifontis]RZS95201.1 2'-5' RNA ligase [Cecembia calidifontis]
MATQPAKYFIALVPEGRIQEEATRLKEEMRVLFNVKYALKSPAHITIKMPFTYNELKQERLIGKLGKFFDQFVSFELLFKGFDRFGRRVIFVDVKPSQELNRLQEALNKFCKTELKLVNELSDKAFHPHMTIAFKDVKPKNFDIYWKHIHSKQFNALYPVKDVALLKRIEGKWVVIHRFILKE